MTRAMMETFLTQVEPFRELDPPTRRRIVDQCIEKRYEKGETIFHEGEQAEAVWVVKEGRVHLMKFSPGGHASTTCVMAPKEIFCCLPALDRRPYPVDAVAATPATLVRIPVAAFHDTMRSHPLFNQRAICLFCDRLRQVEGKGCAIYDSVERRIAQVLLTLQKKFGNTIPLTRQEIAELAGTTVETTIRILGHMKTQKILTSCRGSTTLQQPAKLQAIAEHV